MSNVSGCLMVRAKSSCCDIMCNGSPHLFLFFVRARGKPGNEAIHNVQVLIL